MLSCCIKPSFPGSWSRRSMAVTHSASRRRRAFGDSNCCEEETHGESSVIEEPATSGHPIKEEGIAVANRCEAFPHHIGGMEHQGCCQGEALHHVGRRQHHIGRRQYQGCCGRNESKPPCKQLRSHKPLVVIDGNRSPMPDVLA